MIFYISIRWISSFSFSTIFLFNLNLYRLFYFSLFFNNQIWTTLLKQFWEQVEAMYIQQNRTLNSCTLTICEYFMWPSTQAGDGTRCFILENPPSFPNNFHLMILMYWIRWINIFIFFYVLIWDWNIIMTEEMWEIIKIIFQNVIIFSFKSFEKNLIQEIILKNNNEDRCSLFYKIKYF